MAGDLHEISVAIGELRAEVAAAKESRQRTHERMDRIDVRLGEATTALEAATGALREVGGKLERHIASDDAEFKGIKERLPALERHVDRVRSAVRFGRWVIGLSISGGAVTALWNHFKT